MAASDVEAPLETRREVLATLAIVGTVLGFAAARPLLRRIAQRPPAERCAAMLDHYAEEQARAVSLVRPASSGSPVDRGAAPGRGAPADAVARCTRELTAEEVDCAARAGNVDEIERCLPLP